MAKTNGKSQVDPQELDLEHELPASEQGDEGGVPSSRVSEDPAATDTELQKLKVERDTLLDRLARLQAEFENARKRAAREQQEFRDFATADAIKALLPAFDSFERALQAPATQLNEFRGGVELIYKQLQDALAKLGVRAVPAKGELFDPHVHEAIEMVETIEAPDHQVIDELQRGYKLKDRLLRPAMVRVARNSKH
ncbi:MAG TPA: nucleotide exchange factor GrpE [Terriglobales bacterium]|jgi:molecular chaperone GrpE|nr:nucleotide exchange factor GrpE [Terriglobales bacterium]